MLYFWDFQEAAKKVVTQAFRKGIIDAILPHVIQLKYYLQEKRFPELEFGIIRVLRSTFRLFGTY